MKKYKFIYFLVGSLAFGQETNLDNLLKFVTETSYKKEQYEVKKDLNKKKEKVYNLDEYNGVQTSAETSYDEYDDAYNINGRVKYGNFYIEGERRKREDGNFTYGIEKSLKDLVLSQNDSNLEKLQLEKKIDEKEFFQDLEEQQVNLINLYKDYKEVELEKEIRSSALKTLSKEKLILEKSYSLGSIPKVDLDSLLYSYKNIQLEISNLNKELLTIKEQFLYEFKINISNLTLENINSNKINYKDYIDGVGEKSLEIEKLKKEIIIKNIDYMAYDKNVPDISVGAERNTEYDDNRVFLRVSKDIFYEDITLENEKSILKEKEIDILQKKRDVISERYQVEKNIYTLRKEFDVLTNERSLEESKYKIKKLENKMGKIGYIDVMESFDKYLELKIAEEKAKNNLNSYIYEIKVRGER